ncbi:hypothetical protein HAX54_009503 [Datura stramonium]|uniref:Pentatricopeptide repeat-containing protein n=1 Tax=Datura stramonium TaxID=4076 RepID=A0ABS8THN2_DATST|nr:hypothetical protein [Datura stramonium]
MATPEPILIFWVMMLRTQVCSLLPSSRKRLLRLLLLQRKLQLRLSEGVQARKASEVEAVEVHVRRSWTDGTGFNQDFSDAPEDGESGPLRGGGGYVALVEGLGTPRWLRQRGSVQMVIARRVYDRRSGTEGAGRGNWELPQMGLHCGAFISLGDRGPVNEGEKIVDSEKQAGQEGAGDTNKDSPAAEPEEKEPEEKHSAPWMVSLAKSVWGKGSEKDKRKEAVEKAKKTKSINEFLKPADGESYYRGGGRGPKIEDVGQFPSQVASKTAEPAIRALSPLLRSKMAYYLHDSWGISCHLYRNPDDTSNPEALPFAPASRQRPDWYPSTNVKFSRNDSAVRLFESVKFKTVITWNWSGGVFKKTWAAKSFFSQMPVKDVASWNTMISGFSQNGLMGEAEELFWAMPVRNEVTWNAMVAGYVESGELESALSCLGSSCKRCNQVDSDSDGVYEIRKC